MDMVLGFQRKSYKLRAGIDFACSCHDWNDLVWGSCGEGFGVRLEWMYCRCRLLGIGSAD